jgi:hypothetical protein
LDNYTNNYLLLWVVNSCNFVQTCYINYVRHLIKPNKEAKIKKTATKIAAGEYSYLGFYIFNQSVFGEGGNEWIARSEIIEDWVFDGTFINLKSAKEWVEEMQTNEYFLEALEEVNSKTNKEAK